MNIILNNKNGFMQSALVIMIAVVSISLIGGWAYTREMNNQQAIFKISSEKESELRALQEKKSEQGGMVTGDARNVFIGALKNATYRLSGYNNYEVTLHNGSYKGADKRDHAVIIQASLSADTIAFGDINGDNIPDAVVSINWNTGGTGNFQEIVAMQNDQAKPVYFAGLSLGDRVKINSIGVDAGIVTIDVTAHGAHDPLCCPTVHEVHRYRIY